MQRVMSHAEERLWSGKNQEKNRHPFFVNGTVVDGTGDK